MNGPELDGRPEPNDVAAEQAVLGSMMQSGAAIDAVAAIITDSRDFYRPAHQIIYEAITALHGQGAPTDPVTVHDELRRRRQASKIGGAPYLHTLLATAVVVASVAHHAGIVHRHASRRHVVELLTSMQGTAATADAGALAKLADQLSAAVAAEASQDASAPRRRIVLTPASAIVARPVRWIWDTADDDAPPQEREGRLPIGSLALAAGWAGLGKSQFGAWLTARITKGTLPGCLYRQPKAVIYAAREDSWEMTIKPRLEAAGADVERVYRIDVEDDGNPHARLTLPSDIAILGEAIKEYDVAVVILDPLLSVVDGQINDFRSAEVRTALEPLKELADRTNALVLGLAHFTKSGGGDPLLRIAGAAAFGEVVRAALGFAPAETSPDDSNDENPAQPPAPFVLSTIKNNLGRDRDLPSLGYKITPATVETPEGPSYVSRFELAGTSARSVRDIMAAPLGSQHGAESTARTATSDAAEWVRGYLDEEGDHYACGCNVAKREAIIKAAKADEISEATLKRALSKAGVTTERIGFGMGSVWWTGPCRAHSDHHSAHSDHAQSAELNAPNVSRMEILTAPQDGTLPDPRPEWGDEEWSA